MRRYAFLTGLVYLTAISTIAGQAPELETTRLAEGVYQFRYQSHQGLFVVTGDGVVAIDPISTTAAGYFADAIRRTAPGSPLRAIVYSHDHADHASGANTLRAALHSDAPIIAHEQARQKILERGSPDLPPPDITFSDRLTIRFGGKTLELHYLGLSHSDNMVIAYLPEQRLTFAVDFVTNDGVGYRDLPDYHFPEFFETLRRLLELDFTTIAFGHGVVGDRTTIERQVQYYDDLQKAVEAAIEQGMSEEEAAARVRLPAYREWRGYDSWFPLNVRAIYRWLSAENR